MVGFDVFVNEALVGWIVGQEDPMAYQTVDDKLEDSEVVGRLLVGIKRLQVTEPMAGLVVGDPIMLLPPPNSLIPSVVLKSPL